MLSGQLITLFQGVGGSLLNLFRNGEDGFLFGPFDSFERLFLVSDGTTGNIAANDDPIGLNLDRHSWSGASLAATIAAATELTVNGTFATDLSGWTANSPVGSGGNATWDSGNGGQARLDRTDVSNYQRIAQTYTTVAGKTYRVAVTARSNNLNLSVGTSIGGGTLLNVTVPAGTTMVASVVASGTTTVVTVRNVVNGTTAYADDVSFKLAPGNHALQATTTKRALYKANSGKPYLNFDGSDDEERTPLLPSAAMTLALAFNNATAGGIMLGGGDTASNHRCYLSLDGTASSGKMAGGWGAQGASIINGGVDIRNGDHVGLLTADTNSVDLWLDGALIYSAAPSGSPSGGTGGMTLGGFNNAGSGSNFSAMRAYAALALNRRVTAAEIATITSQFRSAYQ